MTVEELAAILCAQHEYPGQVPYSTFKNCKKLFNELTVTQKDTWRVRAATYLAGIEKERKHDG